MLYFLYVYIIRNFIVRIQWSHTTEHNTILTGGNAMLLGILYMLITILILAFLTLGGIGLYFLLEEDEEM